jgi:phosphoenolpyruvate carboxykinase (GTP)
MNQAVKQWVQETADLCQPDEIYWCNGTEEEYERLLQEMVAAGVAITA